MGIKIKNLQTGEFEKFNIPALKGEKGEPGEIEPSEKVDYIGKQHSKLRDTMNANVDYIIKTAIGEFNYLDYEGQHITATNSIEGHAKSAILKGQTLVNIAPNMTQSSLTANTRPWKFAGSGGVVGSVSDNKLKISTTIDGSMIVSSEVPNTMKPSTKYYVQVEVKNNSSQSIYFSKVSTKSINLTTGLNKFIITTVDDFNVNNMGITMGNVGNVNSGTEFEFSKLMIIEYQAGMENWDIPYFEGMQSVKMPVLTTTGKNTFNSKNAGANRIGWYSIPLELSFSGEVYVKVADSLPSDFRVNIFSNNIEYPLTNSMIKNGYNNSFQNITSIDFHCPSLSIEENSRGNLDDLFENGNIVIELGGEPYKSNILTVNEEVELRGIGEVKDELNLITGELTKRIGEIVLDGSENWNADGNLYFIAINEKVLNNEATSNYLQRVGFVDFFGNSELIGVSCQYLDGYSRIYIRINANYSREETIQYLQRNPLTVQYALATESIKTVDLSDNHVYSYKGTTHYSCSSAEGSLVPTLSVKVPTDTQLTIQEQKATTQTLLIKNMDLQQSIKEVQAMNLAFNTALYNSFNSIREEVEDIKKHVSTNENLEGSF